MKIYKAFEAKTLLILPGGREFASRGLERHVLGLESADDLGASGFWFPAEWPVPGETASWFPAETASSQGNGQSFLSVFEKIASQNWPFPVPKNN